MNGTRNIAEVPDDRTKPVNSFSRVKTLWRGHCNCRDIGLATCFFSSIRPPSFPVASAMYRWRIELPAQPGRARARRAGLYASTPDPPGCWCSCCLVDAVRQKMIEHEQCAVARADWRSTELRQRQQHQWWRPQQGVRTSGSRTVLPGVGVRVFSSQCCCLMG